jgi:hypothetical protein
VFTPLNLEELNLPSMGNSYCFFQNAKGVLPVGQVVIQIDSAVVDVLKNFRFVRYLETSSKLRDMEDVMEL